MLFRSYLLLIVPKEIVQILFPEYRKNILADYFLCSQFYRDGLGYKTNCKENNPPVCFFDTPRTKFELFPLEQLAKDIDENNPPKGNGFSGITLAYNVEHKEDVDSVIELVRNAGGRIQAGARRRGHEQGSGARLQAQPPREPGGDGARHEARRPLTAHGVAGAHGEHLQHAVDRKSVV